MDAPESVKDLFSNWMRWPQKATEMWGRLNEGWPPAWPRLPLPWPPQPDLPFASQEMAREWTRMSSDLMRRFFSIPPGGVSSETVSKSVDAMQVYWVLYEFWTKLVRQMGPMADLEAGDEGVIEASSKLRQEYERVQSAFLGSPPPQTVKEMLDSQSSALQRMLSMSRLFRAPWQDLGNSWPEVVARMASGDVTGIREGFGLWQKAILDTVGKLLNLPAFGMSREHEQRMRTAIDAYLNFQAILPAYYSTFQDAGKDAYEKLMKEAKDIAADSTPEGFRAFYRRWIAIHEDTYFELFRKPEFAELMNRVVDRGLTLRQKVNELTSTYLKIWNVPTREELDDVYKALYEHRGQLKALRRRLDDLESRSQAGTEPMEA